VAEVSNLRRQVGTRPAIHDSKLPGEVRASRPRRVEVYSRMRAPLCSHVISWVADGDPDAAWRERDGFWLGSVREPDPIDDAVVCRVDADDVVVFEGPDAVNACNHAVKKIGRRSKIDPRDDRVRVRIDSEDGMKAVGGDPDAPSTGADSERAGDPGDPNRLGLAWSDD
jgi:hypothetical protein